MKKLLIVVAMALALSTANAQTKAVPDSSRVSNADLKAIVSKLNALIGAKPVYTTPPPVVVTPPPVVVTPPPVVVTPPPVVVTPPPVTTPPVTTGKDSLYARSDWWQYWYELCNLGDQRSFGGPIADLSNGSVANQAQPGYGKVINGVVNDQFWTDLTTYTQAGLQIDSVSLYSHGTTASPWVLSAINNGVETVIANFAGSSTTNGWITYRVSTLAQKLHINTNNSFWPNQWKIWGKWVNKTPAVSAMPKPLFADEINVNGYMWTFENSNNTSAWAANIADIWGSFGGFRLYLDWPNLEPTQGLETWNPIHSGSWMLDLLTDTAKALGLNMLVDIKTLPPFIQSTYPSGGDGQDIPAKYGLNLMDPKSYIEQARNAFQFAARYGSVKVDVSLLTVDKSIRWTNDPPNVAVSGRNTVKYVECDNERDKWWKGMNGYQNGLQYGANLSAFYDGALGTLGAGIGVKTADPNMLVVYAGESNPSVDNFRADLDYCKMYRGGKLNCDVFNVHYYAGLVMPETNIPKILAPLVQVAREAGIPLWYTEAGYDDNSGSTVYAAAIGSKPAPVVKADWILRTALIAAEQGVQKTFFYQANDDSPGSSTQYATSGLLNSPVVGSTASTRRPAADWLMQSKKIMAGYSYVSTATISGVKQDTYANGTSTILVLWSPTSTGKSITYPTVNGTQYVLTVGASSAVASTVSNKQVTVTETPTFLKPSN
jgi:endoglucanase